MKKIKLLTPIFGLIMASSVCMPLASCSQETEKQIETLFVYTTSSEKEVGSTFEQSDVEVKAQYKDGSEEIVKFDGTGTTGYDISGTKFGHEFTTTGTFKFTVIYKGIVQSCSINVVETKPTTTYHTVSFDTGVEGLTVDSQTIENNKCAIEPAVRREGYQVECWTYNDQPFSFTTPITADITLKASWVEVTVGGGNLDSIQYPTITPAAYQEYASTDAIIDAYLTAIKNNTEIFKQDILYSWSISNLTSKLELCKIIAFDKYTSNVEISNIVVDFDKKQIEFDVKIDVNIKINDSVEKSWIEWIGWDFRAIKSTANIHYLLDLTNINKEYQESEEMLPLGSYKNNSYDSGHVRYISGTCGLAYSYKSLLNIESESGTKVDLDGQSKEYSQSSSEDIGFVNSDELDAIQENYPISYLLTKTFMNFDSEDSDGQFIDGKSGWYTSLQISGDNNCYKFASPYMSTSNLNPQNIFEIVSCIQSSSSNACTYIFGISRVLDQIHFDILCNELSNELTLPDGIAGNTLVYNIYANSFNTNNGKLCLPQNCKINLSQDTYEIREGSFYNTSITSINIPQNVKFIISDAFSNDRNKGVVSDTVLIDSNDISSGLTDESSCGYLVASCKTVKCKDGITVGSYITNNFNQGADEEIGGITYHVYNRKS